MEQNNYLLCNDEKVVKFETCRETLLEDVDIISTGEQYNYLKLINKKILKWDDEIIKTFDHDLIKYQEYALYDIPLFSFEYETREEHSFGTFKRNCVLLQNFTMFNKNLKKGTKLDKVYVIEHGFTIYEPFMNIAFKKGKRLFSFNKNNKTENYEVPYTCLKLDRIHIKKYNPSELYKLIKTKYPKYKVKKTKNISMYNI